MVYVHRLAYETFVGEIPQGLTIDHINTVRDDNRIDNLRCVTQKENNNNPLTRQKHLVWTFSEFGRKFREHFGITRYENIKLYNREQKWYYRHNNKCRWE